MTEAGIDMESDLETGQMRFEVWCPEMGVERGDAKTIIAYSAAQAGQQYQQHIDDYEVQFTAYREVYVSASFSGGESTRVVGVTGALVREYSGRVKRCVQET